MQSRGRRPCAVLSHDADNEAEDPHRRTVDQTGTQVLRQCLQSTGHNVGCCLCLLRSQRQLTYILSEERRCSLLWTQHLLRHLYIVYEGLPGGPSAQPAYKFPARKHTTSEVRGKSFFAREQTGEGGTGQRHANFLSILSFLHSPPALLFWRSAKCRQLSADDKRTHAKCPTPASPNTYRPATSTLRPRCLAAATLSLSWHTPRSLTP